MDATPPKPPRLRTRMPPPPPPATPAGTGAAAAPEPSPSPRPGKSLLRLIFQGWIGEGLTVSLVVHGALILLATLWVVSVAIVQPREPNRFVTGSGGGRGGERAINARTKAKPSAPKSLTKSSARITSRSAGAQIALPAMPDLSRTALGALAPSSKSFGGGAGGGLGSGAGLGKGGKNFTGRAVMGMKVTGGNIAVYFDSSPSMNPYFAGVEKQIKEQFPSADIYRYFGVFNLIQDGEVLGGKPNQKTSIPTVEQIYLERRGGRRDSPATDPSKLSPSGRFLFGNKDAQFRAGGVGAWLDVMMNQRTYDALVIFSDFEDGIVQWRTIGETTPRMIFDADLRPLTDLRTDGEKAWEERWVRTFALAPERKAPRLYIYSTAREPQELYRRCVVASGGDYKMVQMTRGGVFGEPATKK